MRVAVIGAGAVGAVLAAASSDSGHDVTLCVRTPIDRLIIEHDGSAEVVRATIATDPTSTADRADVVWVTTKATDTAGAGPWLSALCGPGTIVAAAQNGLDHATRLAPYVPAGTVVPALVYVAAERLAPGRVRYLAGNRVVVPAGEAADRLTAAISGGGLTVSGAEDMVTATWRKLLGNLVANPITAITMRRIGVMTEPGIADLARGLLREAVEVGRAEGARLKDVEIDRILAGTQQFGQQTGSSMLYDRLAGRPLEHQFLTGEVVRRAAAHGIPVPLNAAILALLEAIDRGEATKHASEDA
jgi:2-dehydropantoate 2-reductase